jgi:hypothetical protein
MVRQLEAGVRGGGVRRVGVRRVGVQGEAEGSRGTREGENEGVAVLAVRSVKGLGDKGGEVLGSDLQAESPARSANKSTGVYPNSGAKRLISNRGVRKERGEEQEKPFSAFSALSAVKSARGLRCTQSTEAA